MKNAFNIASGVALSGVILATIANPAVLATIGQGAVTTIGNAADLALNAIS